MRQLCRLLLVTLAMASSEAPAVAQVTAGNAATTHAYLEAKIVAQRAAVASEPTELQAIKALEAKVKDECPDVLTGAPPHVKGEQTNQSADEITEEASSAGFGAGEHVEHPVAVKFAKSVRRLHWSNPKLTRLLRSLAIEQAEQSAIPPPDLCADMKFWVASGYTAVSAGTKGFLHRLRLVSSITLIEPEPHEPAANFLNLNALVAFRLRPYEDHADRLLARKALPSEAKITGPTLRPLIEAVGGVFVALGRSPTPAA